jgi:hypothetical protein
VMMIPNEIQSQTFSPSALDHRRCNTFDCPVGISLLVFLASNGRERILSVN